MRTGVYLTIVVIAVLGLLAACAPVMPTAAPTKPPTEAPAAATAAPKTTAAPTVKRGGTIRASMWMSYDTLDPVISVVPPRAMWILMFDTLVRMDMLDGTGKNELKGELAESWSLIDPKTVEFKLRKGVKFHDGSVFDASVAKANFDRALTHPKSRPKATLQEIASAEVVDNNTLRLNLKTPSAGLLTKLTYTGGTSSASGMMSKVAMDKGDDELGNHPAGTGPFQLEQWLRDDRVILKRFDNYWKMGVDGKPLPYFDRYEERYMPDAAVSLVELKTGNLNLVDGLEPKDIAGIKADPSLVYWEASWAGFTFFGAFPNQGQPPFDNLKLRQAAFYALDRESISKTLGFGVGIPAYYFTFGKGQLGYDESLPRYNYDPEKAKRLVVEAGYPSGVDVPLLFIQRPEDQRVAEMVKSMWDAVGIRTTLDGEERVVAMKRGVACEHTIFYTRPNILPDPDQYTPYLASGASSKFTCHPNSELDSCLAEGRSTYEPAERNEIYKRCLTIMYETADVTAGFIRPDTYAHSRYLKGNRFQWAKADLKEAWLDK